jgi:hypothetical protein
MTKFGRLIACFLLLGLSVSAGDWTWSQVSTVWTGRHLLVWAGRTSPNPASVCSSQTWLLIKTPQTKVLEGVRLGSRNQPLHKNSSAKEDLT